MTKDQSTINKDQQAATQTLKIQKELVNNPAVGLMEMKVAETAQGSISGQYVLHDMNTDATKNFSATVTWDGDRNHPKKPAEIVYSFNTSGNSHSFINNQPVFEFSSSDPNALAKIQEYLRSHPIQASNGKLIVPDTTPVVNQQGDIEADDPSNFLYNSKVHSYLIVPMMDLDKFNKEAEHPQNGGNSSDPAYLDFENNPQFKTKNGYITNFNENFANGEILDPSLASTIQRLSSDSNDPVYIVNSSSKKSYLVVQDPIYRAVPSSNGSTSNVNVHIVNREANANVTTKVYTNVNPSGGVFDVDGNKIIENNVDVPPTQVGDLSSVQRHFAALNKLKTKYQNMGYVPVTDSDGSWSPSNQTPYQNDENHTFGFSSDYQVKHGITPITPSKPGDPGQPINPNDPNSKKYPNGTDKGSLEKSVQRVIHYVTKDAQGYHEISGHNPVTQTVTMQGSGFLDKVTGQWVKSATDATPVDPAHAITWTASNGGKFAGVDSPSVANYHITSVEGSNGQRLDSDDNKNVKQVTANGNVNKYDVYVVYAADPKDAQITYVDDTAHKNLGSLTASGIAGGNISFSKDPATQIAEYQGQGYKLVNDRTNTWGNGGHKYDPDNNKNKFEVHFVHDTEQVTEHAKAQEIIHYVKTENNSTISDDYTSPEINYSRTGTKDKVNGSTSGWSNWTSSNGQSTFGDHTSPTIEGYTPDQASIPTQTVDTAKLTNNGLEKIEKTVKYTANDQNATIKYIDDTAHNTLENGSAKGKFNTDINFDKKPSDEIIKYVNKGYKLVSNNFGNGKKYQSDDKKNNYEVHFVHDTITVDPKHPQKPKDPINPKDPDHKSPKYPDDVDVEHLTDTVNQTIHYVYSEDTPGDKKGKTAKPDVKDHKDYTRTIVFDKVTGEKKSDTWTPSQNFSTKYSPAITGYTANPQSITDTSIAHDAHDIAHTVVYTPDQQKADVTYIDDTAGKELKKDSLDGVTDEKSTYTATDKITNYENMGYELVSNDYPNGGFTFDNNDKADQHFVIHLKHGTVPVTPDKPGDPGKPINPNDPRPDHPKNPNDPHKSVFPPKTDTEGLQKDVNRTITYSYSTKGHHTDSLPDTVKDKLHFTDKKVIDKVTGEQVGKDEWSNSQDFTTIQTPSIKGYTPDRTEVANQGIGHDHKDITEKVVYHPDVQHAHVKYIDDTTGNKLTQKNLDGHTDETDSYRTTKTIQDYVNRGYELVSDNYPATGVVYDNDDDHDQNFEVHLKHTYTTVTPKKPGIPGNPLNPNDPDPKGPKYPKNTDATSLQHDVKRMITYKFSNATDPHTGELPDTVNDSLHFEETKKIDNVTGNVEKDTWTPAQNFADKQSKKIPGYTASVETVSNKNIDHTHPDVKEEVVYTPDPQRANLSFVDDTTGATLSKWDSADGHTDGGPIEFTDGSTDLQYYLDRGYKFVKIRNDNTGKDLAGKTYAEAAQNFGRFDNDDANDQNFTVHLVHDTVTITPKTPGKPGEPINPKDPKGTKYPQGTDAQSLQRDVHRTINYVYSNGQTAAPSVHDSLHFEATKVIDRVTGKVISETWTPNQDFTTISSPLIPGYVFDRASVSDPNIAFNHADIVETVVYTAIPTNHTTGKNGNGYGSNGDHVTPQTNKHQLPQTGNDHQRLTSTAGLAALGMTVLLSMFGKRKKED